MTESDTGLSESRRQALHDDLLKLKADLESLLAATETGAKPVQLKDNKGRLTRMDEMHNQSILVANRNVTKNRLRQVMTAIGRLEGDSGTDGECTQCGEPISFPRLKAYPEASMCLQCKSESES